MGYYGDTRCRPCEKTAKIVALMAKHAKNVRKGLHLLERNACRVARRVKN